MLGPPKPRRLDEPIAVSLEDLVPPDHFYRHLEATLDLGFVRELGARAATPSGAGPSIDPVVFFKLQLIMFFEGHPLRAQAHRDGQPATWPTAGTWATPWTSRCPTTPA